MEVVPRTQGHWFSRSTVEEPVLLPGRLSWLRLLAVPLLLGLPHFVWQEPLPPTWTALGAVASALFLLAGRWPVAAAIGQVTLLLVVQAFHEDMLAFKVMASIAVFEAALTSPPRRAAVPAVLLAGGTVCTMLWPPAHEAGLVIYKVSLMVIAPALLGAFLYAQHRAARERHAAAVAAEMRRRLAERDAAHRSRAAIARELHDVVAHHVASIALRTAVARDVLPDLDPAARRVLDEVNGAAALTLTEMRRLVALLRVPEPGSPGQGPRGEPVDDEPPVISEVEMLDTARLVPELHQLTRRMREVGLSVDLELTGDTADLDAGQALAVLRISQEALTNVLRHAGRGAAVAVRVRRTAAAVGVTVTDGGPLGAADGSGHPPSEKQAEKQAAAGDVGGSGGYGLIGLRERVELLSGSISAGPHLQGWRVHARIPVTDPAAGTVTDPAAAAPTGRPSSVCAKPSRAGIPA
ncbi:hypothetical protein GIS00_26245 [Nakamurella sp. YIM 132087]|uniref:histidine kinase n=1 Tax=Nakamurella alba TaxID=2665158 RepID=A0A7K1FTJ2_9ACTN|nr:histidine kinase [Nakamurella alba]MTD17438.1 hypothetical protein [Nakamurella alba]